MRKEESEYIREYFVSKKGIKQAEQKAELAQALGYERKSFYDLHEYLAKGHKVAIGYHSSTTEKGSISSGSWYGQAILPIDFDNSPKSLNECLELLKPLGSPLFAYETWSANSFRIVYQVAPERAEAWELWGHRKQWIITKSFWQELLEYAGELTGLSVGKTAKGKNNFVIDTNITHQALVLNGTNKTVLANYSAYLPEIISSRLNTRAEAKAEKAIKTQEKAEKRQEELKKAFTGQKWTAEQVEARCKEIGVIATMPAWVGMFNSLLAGVRLGFTEIPEEAAISIFVDYCDNGNTNNTSQYKAMRLNHKAEKANVSSFWGEIGGKPLDFVNLQKAFENSKRLEVGEYINAEQMLNDFEPFKKHLIVAPAGAGKSYSTLKAQEMILERYKDFERTVFTYPTEISARQAHSEAIKQLGAHNVALQYDQQELREFENKQRKLLFCTYDRLAQLIQSENISFFDLIVIDEVHLLNDYSKFKSNITKITKEIISNKLYSVIALTATPQALPIQLFDKVTAYTKDTNKRVTVAITDKRYKSQLNFYLAVIKKQIAKGKKTLIYLNSKEKGEQLAKELSALLAGVGTVGVIHADNKVANKDFSAIVESEQLENNVVIATKIINVAVNIKQSIGAIVAFKLYDITEIMQLINRERYEADFILLYSPKTRRVPNFIVQRKIDFKPLEEEKRKETIEMHKSAGDFHLTRYATNGLVTTTIEEIKHAHKFIVTLIFECWNESYNNFMELTKLLDPHDIHTYLTSIGIVARYIENVKFEDIEAEEAATVNLIWDFKSVKGMLTTLSAGDIGGIYRDCDQHTSLTSHIETDFKSDQRKLAKVLIEEIALKPERYEIIKRQKIFLKYKHYEAFKETEKAIKTGETNNPVIKQILKAKANNDVINVEPHELKEIATFLGVKTITSQEVVREIKKYVLVKAKKSGAMDETGKRPYIHSIIL